MTTKKKTKNMKQGKKNGTGIKIPKNSQVVRSILKFHNEILQDYRITLNKGIKIGKLLADTKKELGHGNWLHWVKKFLPFSTRTATNYINLFMYQAEIKSARVSDIYEAYRLLANAKNHHRTKTRQATKKLRKKFADKKSNYKNPQDGYYTNKVIANNNVDEIKKMLSHGMAGKYTGIITSPNYDANFYYGKNHNDSKPYKKYLQDILKPFPLYTKLLRTGGRVIYIIGNIVKKKDRSDNEDYNYQLVNDLIAGVKKVAPELRFYNQIIWNKSGSGRNPLNNNYGTFANPKAPVTRCCHEHILVWSNKEFELENIENTEPDITPEEFKEWSWSIWNISPYSKPGNPHPCSFPSKLIERLLKFYTWPNDLILDPYAGVSTVAQACKLLNRRFTMVELNPNYCEHASKLLKSAKTKIHKTVKNVA